MDGIAYILLLLLAAALCFAEWALARLRPAWPGLVLPLCLLPPVLFILPNMVLNALGMAENSLQMVLSLLMGLLFFAPTLVLLAIYRFCRRRRKHREQVEKMKIQDL